MQKKPVEDNNKFEEFSKSLTESSLNERKKMNDLLSRSLATEKEQKLVEMELEIKEAQEKVRKEIEEKYYRLYNIKNEDKQTKDEALLNLANNLRGRND